LSIFRPQGEKSATENANYLAAAGYAHLVMATIYDGRLTTGHGQHDVLRFALYVLQWPGWIWTLYLR
jgi:hypothetical protein